MGKKAHRRIPSWIVFGVLALVSATAAGAGEWRGYRGPAGNGSLAVQLEDPGFDLRWIRSIGSGYSGVSVADDFVIASFTDGDSDVVSAFSSDTGKKLWTVVLGPAYQGHDGSHDGPLATPLVAGRRVFALGARGELVAVQLEDGATIWKRDLQEDLSAPKPWYGFTSSPIFVDDQVMIQVGGEAGALVALAAGTGELIWRAVEDDVAYQSPVVTELVGRQQVVFAGMATVSGVDPADGSVLWTYTHQGAGGMGAWSLSPIPVGDDRLFLAHDDHASTVIEIVEGADGLQAEQVWEGRALSRSYSPATVSEHRVCGYVARYLSCAAIDSGNELWRSRSPGDGFLIALGSELAVLTKEGSLHLGSAADQGWSERASLEVFDDLAWSPPSFSNGSLYLRSLGQLARVDVVERKALDGDSTGRKEPRLIADLRREVAASEAPEQAVDAFLQAHEMPILAGSEVIFVWRGEAEDVGIAGDMIGARRDEPMNRVPGTDLWWWATEVDSATRLSYTFFVDFEPTVDPRNSRRVTGTLLGPNMDTREGGMEMSWFATSGWREPEHLRPRSDTKSRGRLVELQVAIDRPVEEDREPETIEWPARVWLPSDYDSDDAAEYPTLYVLDAGALDAGGWARSLDQLVGTEVESVIVVFVEAPRSIPPPATLSALTDQLIPMVDQRFRTDSTRRGVVGHGGSSRFAFELGFQHPNLFDRVAAQSFFLIEIQARSLEAALGDLTAEERPLRMYLDWGKYDLRSPHEAWDMVETARDWDATLRARGWTPAGGEARDGTDWGSWRNRTDRLLSAMFPANEATSREESSPPG